MRLVWMTSPLGQACAYPRISAKHQDCQGRHCLIDLGFASRSVTRTMSSLLYPHCIWLTIEICTLRHYRQSLRPSEERWCQAETEVLISHLPRYPECIINHFRPYILLGPSLSDLSPFARGHTNCATGRCGLCIHNRGPVHCYITSTTPFC
jgi:hypothetical protein